MENKNIIQALCEAKKEFKPIHKNQTNPGFKFDYADLNQYLDATQEALCKHGLFVSQTINLNTLVTTIHYAHSEKTIDSIATLKDAATPQAFGSQLTYLRRYSYAAILGLASEDDDAQESSKKFEPKKEAPKEIRKLEDLKKAIIGAKQTGEELIAFIRKAKTNLDQKYQNAVDYQECVNWMNEQITKLESELR